MLVCNLWNDHMVSATTQAQELLELRLLIAFLGERSQFAWWASSFFDNTSKPFLEPVFGKTAKLTQYHGAVEAARRVHDEHIGVGEVFHLFRMPEENEEDLHAAMREIPQDAAILEAIMLRPNEN